MLLSMYMYMITGIYFVDHDVNSMHFSWTSYRLRLIALFMYLYILCIYCFTYWEYMVSFFKSILCIAKGRTCSKSNQSSSSNKTNDPWMLNILQIGIQDVSKNVNYERHNQRVPAPSKPVSHFAKNRGGNQLSNAIGSHHPSKEICSCCGVKLAKW